MVSLMRIKSEASPGGGEASLNVFMIFMNGNGLEVLA